VETFGQLLEQLGGISPHRIRLRPPPGKATEQDVLTIHNRTGRLFELVDGVLVEKVMGYAESSLAIWLGHLLQNFLDQHDLGILAGEAGALRLMPGLVRIPDISFVRWEQLPQREIPRDPIPGLVPDLAVEVLSEGNTEGEMRRKLKDYFLAGVRLVWFVDPATRTVQVYTAPDKCTVLTEGQSLDGGDVLPGLSLPVRQIFARVLRRGSGPAGERPSRRPRSAKSRKRGKDR
jgi:Uma2 family endonuclease